MAKRKRKRAMALKAKQAQRPQRVILTDRIMKAAEIHAARIEERLARRSADTARIDTTIPESILSFLENLYHEPSLKVPDGKDFWEDYRRVAAILAALRDAYRQGCREGYVEGFVARREPDRMRSAAANQAKRKQVVQVDGRSMTRDDRDAAMAAEYQQLLGKFAMKKTPAMQRLASKYGFESWQGVAAAIERFTKHVEQ